MSTDLTTTTNRQITPAAAFTQLVDMVAPERGAGMVAASSARVYRDTFTRWEVWATETGLDPLDLNFNTVRAYLADRDTSKASQQRELSALRKLAEVLAVVDFNNPQRKAALDSLKLLKVRANEANTSNERSSRALTPADADRLLRVWKRDDSPRGQRNRAIIAVLLLTGLRRSELAALTWDDIDFANGVIKVRHGKGDKARDAAIYSEAALDALRAWQMVQPTGYKHVFVGLRRGGHFTGDSAMSTTAIWNVVDETADLAGIEHVKPHDLRATLATELLSTGDPVHNVQAQLGHSDSSTTLNHYAKAADARQRRKSGRVRYG